MLLDSRISLFFLVSFASLQLSDAKACLHPPCPGEPHISPGCLPAAQQAGHTELWCPGQASYECYKIPTLLRIPNSTKLLAFIEARKYSCDDAGFIDILLRHSPDNGKTWTEPQVREI